MRKLATVMAAAVITLSAGIAFAQGQGQGRSDDIVILKCSQKVVHARGVVSLEGSAQREPRVTQYHATGGFSRPDECSDIDSCAECLQVLILDHGCIAGKAFPGSPLVAAFQDTDTSAGRVEWQVLVDFFFQCNPAGGPPA